jgi:hypothetical protein
MGRSISDALTIAANPDNPLQRWPWASSARWGRPWGDEIGNLNAGSTSRIAFGDAKMPTALLNRLTHHCHMVEKSNESHRFRRSSATAKTRIKSREQTRKAVKQQPQQAMPSSDRAGESATGYALRSFPRAHRTSPKEVTQLARVVNIGLAPTACQFIPLNRYPFHLRFPLPSSAPLPRQKAGSRPNPPPHRARRAA